MRSGPLTPDDLERLYNFPKGDAAGQTVAIAEFSDTSNTGELIMPTYFPDELIKFCKDQKRPAPDVQIVPVNLAPLTPAQLRQLPLKRQKDSIDISQEVMMDVEIIATLAPGARILLYFATFDQKGWVDLLGEVASGRPATPVTLSVSWGLPEDSSDSVGQRAPSHQRRDTICGYAGHYRLRFRR